MKTNLPKLRFKEFTDEWQEKKLGTVADVRDGTHDSPKYVASGYPLVTSKNLMKNGVLDLENVSQISENDFKNIKKRSGVNIGDILFGMIGTIGNPVRLMSDNFAIKNVALIKEKQSLENRFLIHYLNSQPILKQFHCDNTGNTQKFIALGVIRNLKVNIPPLPEQQKIAEFLMAVDEKISYLENKKTQFEKYKKGVMQAIFSQKIRFKKPDGSDYPDWEEKKLGDISECLDNKRKPVNENDRSVMQGNIPYYGANGIVGYVNDYLFNEPLILLAEDGGNFDQFATRPIAQKISGKTWVNNHAHVLRAIQNKSNEIFLFYSLVHKDIRSFINGTSRAKLNKSDLLKISIVMPSYEEQGKIAEFLTSLDNKVDLINKQLDQAKFFKKYLLQQLFV